MYERLKVYRMSLGDCLVPKKYSEDPKLASWVEAQRVFYNRETSRQSLLGGLVKREDSDSDHCGEEGSVASLEEEGTLVKLEEDMRHGGGLGEQDGARVSHAAHPYPHLKTRVEGAEGSAMGGSEMMAAVHEENAQTLDPAPMVTAYAETSNPAPMMITTTNAYEEPMVIAPDAAVTFAQAAEDAGLGIFVAAPVAVAEHVPQDATAATTAESTVKESMEESIEQQHRHEGVFADPGDGEDAMKAPSPSPSPSPFHKSVADERRKKLETIGFVWSLRAKKVDDHWEVRPVVLMLGSLPPTWLHLVVSPHCL